MEPEYPLARRDDLALLPPLYPGRTDRLLYDGMCGLCHRAVEFVLRHDTSGTAFRFMPLQSERLAEELPAGYAPSALPDSMIVVTERHEVLMRSDAALYIGKRMGGIWRVLAHLGERVPRPARDAVYDLIAAIRHRLFARPEQACPVAPPHIRARFDY